MSRAPRANMLAHPRGRPPSNLPPQAGGVKKRRVQGQSTGKRIIEQSRNRLIFVAVIFAVSFLAIGARLVEINARVYLGKWTGNEIAQGDAAPVSGEFEEAAGEEDMPPPPLLKHLRGDITDRNGIVIATSLATASLSAKPKLITNPAQVAHQLAVILRADEKTIAGKLASKKSFVWVKRNLTPREQQQVNSLGVPGLEFLPEERRVYPYENMLAHVLGFVGVDHNGLAGIEKYFDARLRDPDKNPQPLQLSLDLRVQSILYDELGKSVQHFRAVGGTGIVVDAGSGEIVALASLPDFNPHFPGKAPADARFNRASQGTYEMGSTFKTFTFALALDSGIVGMGDRYDATHPIHIAGFTIHDAEPIGRWLSVPEIYAYSSNIGTAKMIMDVGGKKQQQFLRAAGMFEPVSVELPERAKPQVPSSWSELTMMTVAYGHGIAVTPLHLVRGILSVVHDGHLAELTLVKGGNDGKAEGRALIGERTVTQMRRLMRLVVEHGTAKRADVPGYRVGGKTGTAEKAVAGGYNKKAKMALFVSAFPIDNPKYLILVMLDEPQPTKETFGFATGGWVAAPVVAAVVNRMGPMLGIKPVYDAPDDAGKYWVNAQPRRAPNPVRTVSAVIGDAHAAE